MGVADRIRLAAAVLAGKAVASWNWRSGTKPGHLFDGSKFKGSMFYPSIWGQDHDALRERARIAYWESTQARAIVNRFVDNAVGTGLLLESSPIWQLIGADGLTDEERAAKAREIELRFHLWANSTEPDARGKMSLYGLQAFEYMNRLRDGETAVILRYSGDAGRMSPLNIQFVDPAQIQTPYDKIRMEAANAAGNRIINGVEIDGVGREIAIHIHDEVNNTWTRVPFFGPSGRRFVLHPTRAETLGAIRGTSLLAPLVHELQKITDYTVAEIEAAVINAVMAVWIKPSATANASHALAGIKTRGHQETADGDGGPTNATFDKPGLIVQSLKAGEEIESFDTKRPNVNFGEFVRHITRHLSASVGLPIEVLEESFNANYSASRASLILFWNKIEMERERTAEQFLNHVFESWFVEEIRAGRIQAPGFDASPVIRRAWLNCSWLGISKPSIDPLKEANAVDVRIAAGLTTREREALAFNGSDYNENVRRLAAENSALAAANEPLEKASAPSAQPVRIPPEDDDK